MGQRITLSESEKRNILKMYHLVEWTSMDELTPVPKDEIKKYILHSTGVDPRILYDEGIEPKCSRDSKLWKNYEYPCTIHAMNSYLEIWGSMIEGAVVIDTTRIPNHKWWFDPKVYMTQFFKENPSDELTKQYLDGVMEENLTDWSNDCKAKLEDFKNKQKQK